MPPNPTPGPAARSGADGAEAARLADADAGVAPWRRWGPYLAERAWGTVREDYSADGDAWEYLPHDHARSRAYRWNEDGMAGVCDEDQVLCLAVALWNGRDAIVKERLYGLTGTEGNHGEDVKEYWWFLDATPTSSWLRWRYHYPQAAFPYQRLLDDSRARTRLDPEPELLDTGVFDGDRYWQVTVDHAKASPDDLLMRITVRNAGPDAAEIDVMPTLWFRNTWSWRPAAARPRLWADGAVVRGEHRRLGRFTLAVDGGAELLFCENETNANRLWGVEGGTPFPKDGVGNHMVNGAATVNPERTGTRMSARRHLSVPPGGTAEVRVRLRPGDVAGDLGDEFAAVMEQRLAEADAFYAALTPADAGADEAAVMRQAFAGMLWSKQFYHYDVERWLDGDPAGPRPPDSRLEGRNSGWRHLNNHDVISMPDTWEYPWYAAWDLAFHCVALAHVDPLFAKEQLVLMCREWYMHPNGQLPAYEWSFGDVNPPVHAWAALRVFEIDGSRDHDFLQRVFHKLLLNFTWWVNRKDALGNNVFEGGFLGLDNIGPFDRSAQLPVAGVLEQSDATAWMAMYCLNLLEAALILARHDPSYEDVATKFFEHFAYIATAMNEQGLWNEDDGFYYDVLRRQSGEVVPLRVRSMVGLIPLYAVTVLDGDVLEALPDFARRMRWFLTNRPALSGACTHLDDMRTAGRRMLSVLSSDRLTRVLRTMLSEDEFLSPHGLRALSRYHLDHPLQLDLDGARFDVHYEPGESSSGLFGGNSNWRGPVWFPVNYLVIEALRRFHRYLGDGFTVEHPTGSGTRLTLGAVADDLAHRLVTLFLDDAQGRRPVFGDTERMQRDPEWHGCIPFHEYFHGDTGAGLGASHQTGWTGLVADLIAWRGRPRPA